MSGAVRFPHSGPSPLASSLWRGVRVGLLGGSFNPAHDAHRQITLDALRRLRLDQVWWLVSPGNPLKDGSGMAPFEQRAEGARSVMRHPRVLVTAIEAGLGTRYTADTLRRLRARFPATRFVWLMGADNLAQIGRWRAWSQIFHMVPIAVFDRPSYSLCALGGLAARRFARQRVAESRAGELAAMRPPAWVFLHSRLNPMSASLLRERRAAASAPMPRVVRGDGSIDAGVGH